MITIPDASVSVVGGRIRENLDVNLKCEMENVSDPEVAPLILPVVSIWDDEKGKLAEFEFAEGLHYRGLSKNPIDYRVAFELMRFGELKPSDDLVSVAEPPTSLLKALCVLTEHVMEPLVKIRFTVKKIHGETLADCQISFKGRRFVLRGDDVETPLEVINQCFSVVH